MSVTISVYTVEGGMCMYANPVINGIPLRAQPKRKTRLVLPMVVGFPVGIDQKGRLNDSVFK